VELELLLLELLLLELLLLELLLLELLELLELLDLLLQRRDWIAGARRQRRVLHQLLLHFKNCE
jgi:hypothetical protein